MHSVYTAANTERSGSRSSFDVDHELVTDSPGEQDSVELAGKQADTVWHQVHKQLLCVGGREHELLSPQAEWKVPRRSNM